ncbi:hypothetical protein BKA70DRAFT_1419331 [Coprinopsis sp. MPI-PUGE-AT-0042]|nr:hypothetical protein BKA70DRAFT_1419331 [Coprinopsis sp. MPI-PUGE-AT-0042]
MPPSSFRRVFVIASGGFHNSMPPIDCLLRALSEKQQGLLHESIRDLITPSRDACKDTNAHLSQSEKLRLDLTEALSASDSETTWFEKALDFAHSTLEKTQNEGARGLYEQEARQNQDLHFRVQTLQKALKAATAERSRATPKLLRPSREVLMWSRSKASSLQAFPLSPPADGCKGYPLASKAVPKSQVPSLSHLAVSTVAPISSRPTSRVPPSTPPLLALPHLHDQPTSLIVLVMSRRII